MTFIKIILTTVDVGLAIADKVSQYLDKRKDATNKGLTYKDVKHIQDQIDSATSHKVKK